ncbi:MAG: PEP-CTERM sorting domain-containing protein [Bryobacteraceae bacterium]
MRVFRRLGFAGLLLVALTPGMRAGIFSGSSTLSVTTLGIDAAGWDYSGLSLVDTPDGMKYTGTVTAHFTHDGEQMEVLMLRARRDLNVAAGVGMTVMSQITGATVSTTGSLNVNAVLAAAYIGPNSLCYAQVGPFLNAQSTVGSSVADGPATSSCLSLGGEQFFSYLQINTYSWLGGDATLTINFGNSVINEAYADTGVPEPSTMLLVIGASPLLLIGLLRRRS